MASLLLSAVVESFLSSQKDRVASSTFYEYRHYLRRFVKKFGTRQIGKLTPDDVLKFSRKKHPIGAVMRLLNWACKEKHLIRRNPIAGLKIPKSNNRTRIISRVEKVRLLRGADRKFRLFLLGMMESLARPRELREARWGEIRTIGSSGFMRRDLIEGRAFFWFNKFKGQLLREDKYASRIIPISPRFGRLLSRLWGRGRKLESLIFRNHLDQQWTCNAVRCRFRRLRVKVGFEVDVNGEQIVAYSLRHTAATEAVAAGISSLTLAELMGHSDVRMTQRYVHLCPEHLIEAMNSLEAFRRGDRRKKHRPGSRRKRPDGER